MFLQTTKLKDVLIIKPNILKDNRGWLIETYNEKNFKNFKINFNFVHEVHSYSKKGVLRGLHYQLEPFAQAKLVRVIQGKIFDVIVDLRKGSPTYGNWEGFILSSLNKIQLLIPRGFAHGFLVLSKHAEVIYKCDNVFSPNHSVGIKYDDETLNILWPKIDCPLILSEKDLNNFPFKSAPNNFNY